MKESCGVKRERGRCGEGEENTGGTSRGAHGMVGGCGVGEGSGTRGAAVNGEVMRRNGGGDGGLVDDDRRGGSEW